MFTYEEIKPVLTDLVRSSVVISPWLAGVNGELRFDTEIFEMLDWAARDYSGLNWNEEVKIRVFGDLPAARRFSHSAVYETMASTAMHLAHESTGKLAVDVDIARQAVELVEQFADQHGFDKFIQMYFMVTGFENYQALKYYGSMPEQTFLLGQWHRPWIDYSLEDELIFLCEYGTVKVTVRDNRRWVEITERGLHNLDMLRSMLDETGFLKERSQLLRISNFSQMEDYEAVADAVGPDGKKFRKELLAWSGIQPGMRVLELGCGSGALTFEAGLAELVGASGHITAMDPASGMLERGQEIRDALGIDWVDFVQGRAEELPFADNAFDAVIGSLFLHFADIPVAVREMKRVVRPGGPIASVHALTFPSKVPFLDEWFAPLYSIIRKDGETPKGVLPDPETAPAVFKEVLGHVEYLNSSARSIYTDPDKVIRFFIESVGVYQDEMNQLPWKARQELLETLKQNGIAIGQKYTPEELTVAFPIQFVKARKR